MSQISVRRIGKIIPSNILSGTPESRLSFHCICKGVTDKKRIFKFNFFSNSGLSKLRCILEDEASSTPGNTAIIIEIEEWLVCRVKCLTTSQPS